MAQREEKVVVSAGAGGLGAAIATESGADLGVELDDVRARGYWEQVWRRLRHDKVAIASGIVIILLIAVAPSGSSCSASLRSSC